MTVKDLELAKVILVPGTKSFRLPEERMGREDVAERGAYSAVSEMFRNDP